jgi:CheY-like chemotaxis protein
LVNDALDLARIEAGRLELNVEPFDLRNLLSEVVALTAPIAHGKRLEFFEENSFPGPVTVLGDAMRIRQILLNLLGNAVKFTERGTVTLRASPLAPRGLCLEVEDTGPGINPAQRQRLFERFEQCGGVRAAAHYGGSGLGLAICQELTAAMGGRISVDSTPGSGSRFSVELPLEVTKGAFAAAKEPLRTEPPPLCDVTVLLVEDDPTVAEVIMGLLQVRGHRVLHVSHGLAALAEAQTTHFDVMLLDLDLPGMDGIALARQLRASGYSTPLVAITARADADAEPQALAAGIDGFLRKPMTGAMLIMEIARVLHRGEQAVTASSRA